MKILVTGATGFIGSTLVQVLQHRGYQVKVLLRRRDIAERLAGLDLEVHQGDLTDPSSLAGLAHGIDAVCHLAGVLGETCADEQYYYQLHVQGTANLLAQFEDQPIKKFVHCSTTGVLGPTTAGIADESYPYNPSNVYETTKAEGEKVVLKYGREHNIPVVVLRPGMVYGPGDMHHLGLFWAIKKHYFFLIDSGKSYLDSVFVEDVTQAFILGLNSPRSEGQVYMIAGSQPTTVSELASTIARALGHSCRFPNLPFWMAMGIARGMSNFSQHIPFSPPLTPSRVKFLTESRACSIGKAKQHLNYKPIGLEEGIMKTVAWYRAHGYL